MAFKDSEEATVEKAQQDPHCPWFLTAWTFPWVTQLTSPTEDEAVKTSDEDLVPFNPRYLEVNSSLVISANSVNPAVDPSLVL